jgi:hypothetical protein
MGKISMHLTASGSPVAMKQSIQVRTSHLQPLLTKVKVKCFALPLCIKEKMVSNLGLEIGYSG